MEAADASPLRWGTVPAYPDRSSVVTGSQVEEEVGGEKQRGGKERKTVPKSQAFKDGGRGRDPSWQLLQAEKGKSFSERNAALPTPGCHRPGRATSDF